MNIFVINSGSSSLKYQLINPDENIVLCKGLVDRIGCKSNGSSSSVLSYKYNKDGNWSEISEDVAIANHEDALKLVMSKITDKTVGVISSLNEIYAIGHRVVHGGEKFSNSVLITNEVIEKIKECIPLGPLHNPANLAGIEACNDIFPGKKQVAVFDTAFHQTIPPHAYFYGIKKDLYDKYKIRRYGFHGTSYKYITEQINEEFPNLKKIIICHLGNGSSICAINEGKSIDTSMGFTPLEGLVMGTRSGDIDPAIVSFISKNEGKTASEVESMLNKESGLLGISRISSDMRDLWAKEKEGNNDAKVAIDLFSYRIRKYIGAYMAALCGVDAIIFTGGIGQNAYYIRKRVLEGFEFLGLKLDDEKNMKNNKEVSSSYSSIKVFVLETNEEYMIAKDTEEICR